MIIDIADPEYDPILTFGGFFSEPPFCYTSEYRLAFVTTWLSGKHKTCNRQQASDVVTTWELAGLVKCCRDSVEITFKTTKYGRLILMDFQIRTGKLTLL